jgi:threonine dehydrogenase-like Zn-dependent dehydrogenase
MAVAWHAVNRGEVTKKDVTIVLGCGPVGLAVIAVLKARGVATIIASDFSPGRRALAQACGADVTVDPESSCVGAPTRALIRWRLLGWTSSGACAGCGRPVGVVADLVAAVGEPQMGGA